MGESDMGLFDFDNLGGLDDIDGLADADMLSDVGDALDLSEMLDSNDLDELGDVESLADVDPLDALDALDADAGDLVDDSLGTVADAEPASPTNVPDVTFGSYQFEDDNHPTDSAYKDHQGNYYKTRSDYLSGKNPYDD